MRRTPHRALALWAVPACVALSLAALACKKPPPKAPAQAATEPCPKVGEADPTRDVAKLHELFNAHGRSLVVSEGIVYEIPCSSYKVAGASESSTTVGHGEDSSVVGKSEASQLGTADERSRLAAANEASRREAANEASKVGRAAEDSERADASSLVSCQRLAPGSYKLLSRVELSRLRVFDGATFFDVGPDGLLR